MDRRIKILILTLFIPATALAYPSNTDWKNKQPKTIVKAENDLKPTELVQLPIISPTESIDKKDNSTKETKPIPFKIPPPGINFEPSAQPNEQSSNTTTSASGSEATSINTQNNETHQDDSDSKTKPKQPSSSGIIYR